MRQERPITDEETAFCERSIPAAFADAASRYPEALALDGDERATYREIAVAADRVAHALNERLGPASEPVGLLFKSTRGLVESLLGVLAAGKIAMPLDLSAPRARLEACVADSGARLLLGDVPSAPVGQIVSPDALGRTGAGSVSYEADADSPSVLVYTSGSSGEPKAVLRRQGSDLHGALMSAYWLKLDPESRYGLCLSPAFSYSMIFTTLLSGATLVRYVVDDQGLANLPAWIVDHQISATSMLSSWVRPVAIAARSRSMSCLNTLMLGGEPLGAADLELARSMLAPNARVLQGYGSTEIGNTNTIALDRASLAEGSAVPVGLAVPGKRLRLADVEDGVGEIVVTSRYLSHGYWRRDQETARAFSLEPGGRERAYRTGDLGRIDEHGRLVIVGRLDRMVKVAGKRVELDAVEHALLAHEQVGDAAVVARQRPSGTHTLVGYVSPRSGTIDPRVVKESLRRTLPPQMVPGRLVALDVLPRLPNGKVDRRALADTRSSTPTPPTNELERRLVEVWQELLELPVGLDDDFFELGGDSLLVMEMLVEVEQRLSCKLSPGALLEARTPSSLAALICGLRSGRQRHTGNAGRDRPRLYFTYSIGGTGLRYRALVDALGDDLPVHALDAPWWDGRPSELQTVEQLAAHHITEIKELQPDGPYLLGGYSGGGLIALEIARQLGAAGEQIALLAVVDTPVGLQRSPFDPRSLLTAPPSSPGRLILRHLRLFLATQRYRATAAGRRMARLARRPRSWIDLRRLGEVPERHRPSYVHDRIIAALAAYRPLPYEGHVTLCRCPASSAFPADCGWGTLARGGLTIHDLAGTHLEVLDPPFVEQLALLLADAIHTGVDRPAAPARDAPTTQQEHQPV